MDAGRVPGRADFGDSLHGGGRESRRGCRAAARLCVGLPLTGRRFDSHPGRARSADNDPWQRGRHRPDRHQTHVGLCQHRPGRIHPDGFCALRRPRRARHVDCRRAVLPAGLHVDQFRRVGRGHPARTERRQGPEHRRLRRSRTQISAAGGGHDGLHALVHRPAAHAWVGRQSLFIQRRHPGRVLLACGHRRADLAHLGLLLPARGRDHVHARRRPADHARTLARAHRRRNGRAGRAGQSLPANALRLGFAGVVEDFLGK